MNHDEDSLVPDELPGEPAESLPGPVEGMVVRERPGRSAGIYALVFVNVALAAICILGLRLITGAHEYGVKESADIGSDLEAMLAGLEVMRIALYALAAGFGVSALAVLSPWRIGWFVQALWAVLMCLSVAGIPYGLPVLVFLFRRGTRARFFGV
jgi:hypothetical protein